MGIIYFFFSQTALKIHNTSSFSFRPTVRPPYNSICIVVCIFFYFKGERTYNYYYKVHTYYYTTNYMYKYNVYISQPQNFCRRKDKRCEMIFIKRKCKCFLLFYFPNTSFYVSFCFLKHKKNLCVWMREKKRFQKVQNKKVDNKTESKWLFE